MATKSRSNSELLAYLVIVLAWAVSFATKLHTNGLLYGLDFGLYHPDGTLYTFRTLTWMGKTEVEAGLEISRFYASHAAKFTIIDPETLHFGTNPGWEIYKLRYLYPFLSIPFVYLFGVAGMLAIPAISLLILMIMVFEIAKSYGKPFLGIFIALFFSFSLTVTRWMYANTADPLLTALLSITVLVLVKQKKFRYSGQILLILALLSSITRFALFIWVAIALVFFIQKSRRVALALFALAVCSFLPTLFVNFTPSVLASDSDMPLMKKIIYFPFFSLRVAFFEIAQLLVLDRYLILFLIITSMVALFSLNSSSSLFYLCAVISLWLTGAINGVVGVNFRYQLPLLPFAAWVILESGDSFSKKIRLYFSRKFL